MYRLYRKNELTFALVWIIAYVVIFSFADNLSATLGIEKVLTAPFTIVFTLVLYAFIRKNKLEEQIGLCSVKGDIKSYLYFAPLLIIMTVNLWLGAMMNLSALETGLYILSMLCVGFIEEIVFRGFLFQALRKDNLKEAIIISSVTFGIGHIVNLINGRDLIPTLLQVCYAIAIGFVFTVIVWKGKSLWPCIIAHGVLNSLGAFAVNDESLTESIIISVVLCVISVGYALWILQKTKTKINSQM